MVVQPSVDAAAAPARAVRAGADPVVSGNNPIKKKIDKLIASKLHNDPEFLSMMDYVSPLVPTVDMHTERRLRRELERKELSLNRDYLAEFERVNGHVQTFASKVREMHSICSDLTARIEHNKKSTQDLLGRTGALQQRKKQLEARGVAIDDFLATFSLTEAEERALEGNAHDGTVSADFFPALARVREVHAQSRQLLRTNGDHSAALEIMEEMSQKMEKAYEVLYRSIQRECRVLNSDFVELKGVLCQSLAALQDREVLLKYALEEFATARKNHVLRLYIDALTRGGSGGQKPIELLSHDPLRYIGDMLAWIYEAVESERDLLQLLTKNCAAEVLSTHGHHVLGQISAALCRPFKVRVEQALAGESDCVVLYRLSALFTFYAGKIGPLVAPDCELLQTVEELNQLALNIFHSGLNQNVARILGKMGAPDYDLLPVPAVHQCLLLLRDVLESHEGAVAGRADAKEQFDKVLSSVLDPLLRSVQIAATQLHSPLDVAVYTLNCLSAVHSQLILYPYTDRRLEMVKGMMEGNEDVLVSEEASSILANTGMIGLYTKAAAHTEAQGPLSALPGMEPSEVSRVLSQWDAFLARPDSCRLAQTSKVASARVRESVHERTVANVVAAYGVVLERLRADGNKYEEKVVGAAKTVEQVKELLK